MHLKLYANHYKTEKEEKEACTEAPNKTVDYVEGELLPLDEQLILR